MLVRCFTARKPQNDWFIWSETPFHMILADRTDCFTRLFNLSRFGAGRLFHTWATTLSSTPLQQLLLVGTLLPSFPTRDSEYLDLTHCDCPLLLKQDRTFPSTVFSAYTMEEIWQPAHSVQQRCCPLYKEIQLGVVWNVRFSPSCLGGTGALKSTHVFMRWQIFFLLFLDTNEAIPAPTSRTAIKTTTLFSQTHFHSIKRPIPRVLSALIMHNLHSFFLSIYFCNVPKVVSRYSLLWEHIVFCFRVVSVSMWYLLLHVFIW